MTTKLTQLRVLDHVVTTVIHGYAQAESIAPFIAPVVPVEARAGKVVKFDKSVFAVYDAQRAPGTRIKRVNVTYDAENFNLTQLAMGGTVTEEEYTEARSSAARIDLRKAAALKATAAVMQSWEKQVVNTITDPTQYESSCTVTLAGTDQFDDPNSNPERIVFDMKEAVRSQVGVYPNSAVISPKVYQTLRLHPIFTDRVKYTSTTAITLELLAVWFDLPRGVRLAQRLYLDENNKLRDFMDDSMVLFYNPSGDIGQGLTPEPNQDRTIPAFAYTYTLQGYPIATPERFDEDTREYITDVIYEQSLQLVGLGETGKVGAGALIKDVLAVV